MFIESRGLLLNMSEYVTHDIERDHDEDGNMVGRSLYVTTRSSNGPALVFSAFDGMLHAQTFLTMCIRKAHHFGICEQGDMKEIYRLSETLRHSDTDARNFAVLGMSPERGDPSV